MAFFTCLNKESRGSSRVWLTGMRDNMSRMFFKRSMISGEEQDKSSPPLYLCHVKDMSKSLARKGGREAASRKFAIKSLHLAAGRSGEVAYMSYRRLAW
jgi:hypothetical protein